MAIEGMKRPADSHLSVQETNFFRNLPQFDALRKYVIPEIARRKAAHYRRLKFWSAGCSTGQEPYSIAMSIHDVLPDPQSWEIQILATDLDEQALEIASKGWYPESRITGIGHDHLSRYFVERDGGYQARDCLRRLISFSRHDMVVDNLPLEFFGTCDIVFCCNVIIDLTHQTARHVIELFFDILNPGGYLFLGHSETLWQMSARYNLVEMGDAFIYKKSLPRAIDGRRFIADRRMRDIPLPPWIDRDRRKTNGRRGHAITQDVLIRGTKPAQRETGDAHGVTAGPMQKDDVREACGKARAMIDLGEHSKAVEMLADAVNGLSPDCDSYYILGLAYQKLNRLDEAIAAFRKALFCDNSHGLAYFHLANVLEAQGQFKQAVKEYRNASKFLIADKPERWQHDLESCEIDSLVDLCQWKFENLGGVEG